MAKRLTEHHPLSKKVDELFAFLEDKNIQLICTYQGVAILDNESGLEVNVVDSYSNQPEQYLPCTFEYKLIISE